MRILIATDAWYPQVNGVVMTLENVGTQLRQLGHEVQYLTPADCLTVPCPTYPDIRLALFPGRHVATKLLGARPDAIHIATEGPIGHAVRRYCRLRGWAFTTSYHTQFPQYVRLRAPIPVSWTYRYLRRFHGVAAKTFVATPSLRQELQAQGFRNTVLWSRGVDTDLFRPGLKSFLDLPRPLLIYVGRVAVEKNLRAFLSLDCPGSKLIIGEGPDRQSLQQSYPRAHFLGVKRGPELVQHLAAADVFVFPSRTDTFGLVLLEAMACGVPIAAYPVTGPLDVVMQGTTGHLDEDLGRAVEAALKLDGNACVTYAQQFSWQRCAEVFATHLVTTSQQRTVWTHAEQTP
jgi:glycosyltransferase involved in cell wall biosynthesis